MQQSYHVSSPRYETLTVTNPNLNPHPNTLTLTLKLTLILTQNHVSRPADGTCAINVYGSRGSDHGVTCRVSCAKMGLKCVSDGP